MKMMGLDNWLHWLAWFVKYFLSNLVTVGIMTLFMCVNTDKGPVIGNTDPSVVVVFLLLYSITSIAFCFAVSAFFTRGLSNMSKALNECIKKLEKESNGTYKDGDYPELVKYTNCFLNHFGKERVHLAGSHAEHLKVQTNKDGGDTDILLISGKLEIPAENIELRNDTPCFIHIKVDKASISKTISLIDGNYLSSDVVRSVGPEVFTLLRCIYFLFICGTSNSPSNTADTTFNNASKVGLAINEYKNLKVKESISTVRERCLPKRKVKIHDESFRAYIKNRQGEHEFYKQDVDLVERVIAFMSYMKIQGDTDSNIKTLLNSIGKNRLRLLKHLTDLFNLLQERLNEPSLEESLGKYNDNDVEVGGVTFENDIEAASCDQSLPGGTHESDGSINLKTSERNIHATCTRMWHIDMVPALKIIGRLDCMEVWKTAQHLWLSPGEIDVIANMNVFCVARYAPVNPSKKDFCLSFTLAENKLTECLSPIQRPIVLIMKAFLKGIFTTKHLQSKRALKLTSFHIKTVIYRVSDVTEPSIWSEVDVAANLTRVLTYLKEALRKKELLHYFVPSNLFAGFEDEDFKILLECTDEVISDPLGCVNAFFELDDGKPIDIWLTEEEVANFERRSTDDGIGNVVDIVEESMIEFLRGLKESPRDAEGNTPIVEAFRTVLQMFIRPEVLAMKGGSVLTCLEKILKPRGFISEDDNRLALDALVKLAKAYASR